MEGVPDRERCGGDAGASVDSGCSLAPLLDAAMNIGPRSEDACATRYAADAKFSSDTLSDLMLENYSTKDG